MATQRPPRQPLDEFLDDTVKYVAIGWLAVVFCLIAFGLYISCCQ